MQQNLILKWDSYSALRIVILVSHSITGLFDYSIGNQNHVYMATHINKDTHLGSGHYLATGVISQFWGGAKILWTP